MNISYTSLDDLYKTDNKTKEKTNKYDSIIKNLIQSNKRNNIQNYEIPDPITPPSISIFSPYSQQPIIEKKKEKKIEKKIENNISLDKNKEKFTNNRNDCKNFLQHLTKCEKCRNYIFDNLKKKHREENNIIKEELLDISIFVLSGIFVLFLVDSLINLGKILK
jgi:type III secretory pathway component EscR